MNVACLRLGSACTQTRGSIRRARGDEPVEGGERGPRPRTARRRAVRLAKLRICPASRQGRAERLGLGRGIRVFRQGDAQKLGQVLLQPPSLEHGRGVTGAGVGERGQRFASVAADSSRPPPHG